MGRRHLSRLLPFGLALAVAASAAAASAIPFRVVVHGISTGLATAKPFALVGPSRVSVHRIVLDLTVHLTLKPLAPGTAECQAIFETARVLVVPRAALHGTPAKAMVTVAGS
ncbi:MAG TPA: hypothetical protein VGI77_09355 [Gaiellaceae bacterium]